MTEFDTVASALSGIARALSSAGIPDARIEARVMVMEAADLSRAEVLSEPGRALGSEASQLLGEWLERRLGHEPLPYITGRQEFFGRTFQVDRRVLIPRPETESLVEQVMAFVAERGIDAPVIADIGTGSGALAVTLACVLPGAKVIATDLSPEALEVASMNAGTHGASGSIEFRHGDLLEPVTERCDVIVCNPPYVLSGFLDGEKSQPELRHEPRTALDGGRDGMDTLRRLISALPGALKPSASAAYVEIDPPVAGACIAAAIDAMPDAEVAVLNDLAGLERCLAIELG